MEDGSDTSKQDLTIIGIGSSAGGLEAIRELVGTLPDDLPVTYVVVQHMSPHHKSLMTELVDRETKLTVVDVTDNVVPQPNIVYITPPKADIILEDGRLRLVDPSPAVAWPKPSVDRFLLSLADTHGENSVAIILSGTGSDGSYGVQAVREAGGITIAQTSESAKYDGMPSAAVQTGCVDLILKPEDIGRHLQKILTSPRDFDSFRSGQLQQSPLSDLLQILLARTRVDFREYKQTTINRRIERRMVALGIESRDEYTQFCRNNPHAVDALYKDLLISVTRFFRDPNEFDELKKMLPDLVDRSNGSIRVWIAGCATGEEAYSIAMLLSEVLGGPEIPLKDHVQIFATDIDEAALKVARKGFYNLSALHDIPPDIAEKYLIKEKDGVRFTERVRNAILFSHHNVCQDPPFQKIDLLCCRNLLIYFSSALQQKVMSRFYYAMSDESLMFLGTAEGVAGSEMNFVQDSRTVNIFRRKKIKSGALAVQTSPRFDLTPRRPASLPANGVTQTTDRLMFDALVQSLGANSLVVSEDGSILRINGNISQFIKIDEQSSLRMHLDLLRSPMRDEARSMTTLALKYGKVRRGNPHLLDGMDDHRVRLDVYPIVAKEIDERAAVVVFNTIPIVVDQPTESTTGADLEELSHDTDRVRLLETEIANTREALQQTIEELETSNEELQSLNEEMQSTNEELQATNEELETSNEELQSTNEELITVNEELQVTAAELNGRTSELMSILDGAPMAIVVLDNALQITQASAAAAELFKLSRPITMPHVSQCQLPSGCPPLAPICNETLRLGQKIEHEFTSDDAQYVLTSSPFFDERGQIQGVTIIFSIFPGLAREMELILDSSQMHVMNREYDGTITRISAASAKALGSTRKKLEGANLYDFLSEETGAKVKAGDEALLAGSKDGLHGVGQVKPLVDTEGFWLSADRLTYFSPNSDQPSIYSLGYDVTDLVNARQEVEAANRQLSLLQEISQTGHWSLDLETGNVTWSEEVYRIHGVSPKEFDPNLGSALDFYHPDDRPKVEQSIERISKEIGKFSFRLRLVRKSGEILHVESLGASQANENGEITKLVGVFRDAGQANAAPKDRKKAAKSAKVKESK